MSEESRIVEETRQKIASGELTYNQMKEKLIASIDKEYEKEGEPNVELINACEELLAELATDGQPLPESHQEKYGEVSERNIQVSRQARSRGGFIKRLAVSLVIFVLLWSGGQAFLHREWYEQGTTDDEQQHMIQGFVVEPNLIANCIAEKSDSSAFYHTDRYTDVKKFLGFDLPAKMFLKDWSALQYSVEIQSAYVKSTILYSKPRTKEEITVQAVMYTNVNNAYAAFEKSEDSIESTIKGIAVFHSNNINTNTVMWIEGNCIWRCYGTVNDEQLSKIVEPILGGVVDD